MHPSLWMASKEAIPSGISVPALQGPTKPKHPRKDFLAHLAALIDSRKICSYLFACLVVQVKWDIEDTRGFPSHTRGEHTFTEW